MRVFCDFDGTIATVDVTDRILTLHADPAWEIIEADWVAGRISAAQCMRQQISLIRSPDALIDRELEGITFDPGFVAFAAWCREAGLPLTIVSDGVDRFIRPLLERHGLSDLPVFTNMMVGAQTQRTLKQPWLRDGCAAGAGVCKCAVVGSEAAAGPIVYVGDGRSDFCVSARADILFAKDALADYAAARGQSHYMFSDFSDIQRQLTALMSAPPAVAI